MSEGKQQHAISEPAPRTAKPKREHQDQERPEGFGKSFATNSGLEDSTGVGRKDTPDAAVDEHGIAGGPDTGASVTSKP
jgi:hypothetical protein